MENRTRSWQRAGRRRLPPLLKACQDCYSSAINSNKLSSKAQVQRIPKGCDNSASDPTRVPLQQRPLRRHTSASDRIFWKEHDLIVPSSPSEALGLGSAGLRWASGFWLCAASLTPRSRRCTSAQGAAPLLRKVRNRSKTGREPLLRCSAPGLLLAFGDAGEQGLQVQLLRQRSSPLQAAHQQPLDLLAELAEEIF